jgi:hypothetical protein
VQRSVIINNIFSVQKKNVLSCLSTLLEAAFRAYREERNREICLNMKRNSILDLLGVGAKRVPCIGLVND